MSILVGLLCAADKAFTHTGDWVLLSQYFWGKNGSVEHSSTYPRHHIHTDLKHTLNTTQKQTLPLHATITLFTHWFHSHNSTHPTSYIPHTDTWQKSDPRCVQAVCWAGVIYACALFYTPYLGGNEGERMGGIPGSKGRKVGTVEECLNPASRV